MNFLPFLFALAANAAPLYLPNQDLKNLRLVIESFTPALERFAAVPLAPQQTPALKTLLADSLRLSADARLAGKNLGDHILAVCLEMIRIQKEGAESFGSLSSLVLTQRRRHDKANDTLADLKARYGRLPKKDPRDGEALRQAAEELSAAHRLLKDLEARLKDMEEERGRMKKHSHDAEYYQKQSQQALDALAQSQAAMQGMSGGLQASFENLHSEPLDQTRARAHQKRQPFLDEGRGLYSAADVFFHREDDFQNRERKFEKALAGFLENRKVFPQGLSDAGITLDRAERALAQIRL